MKIVCLFLLFICSLDASLSLYNDSVFPLNVKVLGANGAFLGEKEIEAQGHYYFEDQIGTSDPVGIGEDPSKFKNYKFSLTPYQVFWYCSEGTVYSSCLTASAGATVTANTCPGIYGCKPEDIDGRPKEYDETR